MKNNHMYESAYEAIQCLRKEGYLLDFKLDENCIFCEDSKFAVEQFNVVNIFRFDDNYDPIDDAVVYAIESNTNQRGILVTAYAINIGTISKDLILKLEVRDYSLIRA